MDLGRLRARPSQTHPPLQIRVFKIKKAYFQKQVTIRIKERKEIRKEEPTLNVQRTIEERMGNTVARIPLCG